MEKWVSTTDYCTYLWLLIPGSFPSSTPEIARNNFLHRFLLQNDNVIVERCPSLGEDNLEIPQKEKKQ